MKRLWSLVVGSVLAAVGAMGQPSTQIPLTPYMGTNVLLSTSQSNLWYRIGIVASNQTEVTNWITVPTDGSVTWATLAAAVKNQVLTNNHAAAVSFADDLTVNSNIYVTGNLIGNATVAGEIVSAGTLNAYDVTVSGTMSGNGGGITNMAGTGVQLGTINSNKLDAATAALLAMHYTGEATNAIANYNGVGTNATLLNPLFTDDVGAPAHPSYTTNGGGGTNWFSQGVTIRDMSWYYSYPSNRLGVLISNGVYNSYLSFCGPAGLGGGLTFWPDHGGAATYTNVIDPRRYASPEMIVSSAGTLALDWGAAGGLRGLQLGVAGYGSLFAYLQYLTLSQNALPWNTNLGTSIPMLCAVKYYTGSAEAYANCGGSGAAHSGWNMMARDTNGNTEMVFWDYFDTTVSGYNFDWGASKPRMRILFAGDTGDGGLDLRGRMILERDTGTIIEPTQALDFKGPYCTDYSPTVAGITFYATNNSASTNYEKKIFVVRAGETNALTVGWPTNWTWFGDPPTTVAAGELLKLELESIGLGQSNILATAYVGTNYGEKASIAATNFSGPAGLSGLYFWYAANSNTYPDGTYTNWPDSSGNSYTAVGAAQTPYYTNAGIVVGTTTNPAYWFTGGSAALTNGLAPASDEFVCFAVTEPHQTAQYPELLDRGWSSNFILREGSNYTHMQWKGDITSVSGTNDTVRISAFARSGSSVAIYNLWTNTSAAASGSIGGTTPFGIGNNSTADGIGFKGAIAELIYYTNALSGANITNVLNYLATKYGL